MDRLVRCANCNHEQTDRGQRSTCIRCGCQPVPSYAYPKPSSFYPRAIGERRPTVQRLIAQRRKQKA